MYHGYISKELRPFHFPRTVQHIILCFGVTMRLLLACIYSVTSGTNAISVAAYTLATVANSGERRKGYNKHPAVPAVTVDSGIYPHVIRTGLYAPFPDLVYSHKYQIHAAFLVQSAGF